MNELALEGGEPLKAFLALLARIGDSQTGPKGLKGFGDVGCGFLNMKAVGPWGKREYRRIMGRS